MEHAGGVISTVETRSGLRGSIPIARCGGPQQPRGKPMRDKTIVQAQDEIETLDKISVLLSDTLRAGYERLRANSPAVRRSGGDIEVEARLHNMRLSALDALEEVGRRGYGRVALLEEINDAGDVVGHRLCRVSSQCEPSRSSDSPAKQPDGQRNCVVPSRRRTRNQAPAR